MPLYKKPMGKVVKASMPPKMPPKAPAIEKGLEDLGYDRRAFKGGFSGFKKLPRK